MIFDSGMTLGWAEAMLPSRCLRVGTETVFSFMYVCIGNFPQGRINPNPLSGKNPDQALPECSSPLDEERPKKLKILKKERKKKKKKKVFMF